MARGVVPYSEGVPGVLPQVDSPGLERSFQRIPTNIDEFGGAIAKGEEQLGQGALKATQVFSDIAADQAINNYQDEVNKVLMGDPAVPGDVGYLGLKGQDAMNAREGVMARLQQAQEKALGSLPNLASQNRFSQESRYQRARIEMQVGSHYEQQANAWGIGVNQASADGALRAIEGAAVTNDQDGVDRATQKLMQAGIQGAQLKYGPNLPPEMVDDILAKTRAASVTQQVKAIARSDPSRAQRLLDANKDALLGAPYDALKRETDALATSSQGHALAQQTLGAAYAGALPAPPSQITGGAVAGRIAEAAKQQNVDSDLALRTAHIESGMGQNLGARGNIFQLGANEWREAGGGNMADTETQIRNGVAWLGKVKDELGAALGREPTPAEIYLGHQQGVGGAVSLLSHPATPAGQLVPPQNIRANGGDPNAPASAFIAHWERAYDRAGGGTPAAVAPAANAPGGNIDTAIGDSISVQQIRHHVGGVEAPMGQEIAGATARIGDTPAQVNARLAAMTPDQVKGKTVFLSSGASNDPAQAVMVGGQIATLKALGASAIVVPGVGPGVKNADQVNAVLKEQAQQNGAVFFQPQVRWQADGIHPAEVDKVRAQAQAALTAAGGNAESAPAAATPGPPDPIAGNPTPQEAAAPAASARDRSLASMHAHIFNSDASDDVKLHAWNEVRTQYDALEADNARQARLAQQQQQQAMEGREAQIWADAYSPAPKITARDIAVDPAFAGHNERRAQMIALVNNPPGSAVPAAQSYQAALALLDRIRKPDGDPRKITDMGPIYDAATKGQLNKSDFEFVKKEFADVRTPGGEMFARRKADFLKSVEPQIDKSAFAGIPDTAGKSRFYQFNWLLDQRIDEYRKAGKNPLDLIDPAKPDYLGKPEALQPFRPQLSDLLKDLGGGPAPAAPGAADLSSQAGIVAAYRAGAISREQASQALVDKGFAAPAAPAAPQPAAPLR